MMNISVKFLDGEMAYTIVSGKYMRVVVQDIFITKRYLGPVEIRYEVREYIPFDKYTHRYNCSEMELFKSKSALLKHLK
jgi:hypothetical protein